MAPQQQQQQKQKHKQPATFASPSGVASKMKPTHYSENLEMNC